MDKAKRTKDSGSMEDDEEVKQNGKKKKEENDSEYTTGTVSREEWIRMLNNADEF